MWPSFRGDAHNTGRSKVTLELGSEPAAVDGVLLGGLIWGTAVWCHHGESTSSTSTRVYVGSTNRVFACIELPTAGRPRVAWTFVVPQMRADALIDSAASLSPDGTQVVVPGGDGCLYALDTLSGDLAWTFEAASSSDVSGSQHDSGVVVNSFEGNVRHSRCGSRVLAGSDNASIYCVDTRDRPGSLLWRVRTGMMVWTVCAQLTMAPGRDVAVFGSLDRSIYVLDEATGEQLAAMSTGGEVKASPAVLSISPTMDAAELCVCNSNGTVQLVSLRVNGGYALRSEASVDLPGEIYGSPAVMGDLVFVCDMSGGVTCLRSPSLTRVWRSETYGYIAASPLATKGRVVVATGSGHVLALGADAGQLEGWAQVASGHRRALNASPVLLPDGRVCVGSYDGHVYFARLGAAKAGTGLDALMLPLDARGRRATHAEVVSEPDADVVSLILRPYDADGRYVANARLDASTLRVTLSLDDQDARDLYDAEVSPDGRYVNLLPRTFILHDGVLRVSLRGEFRVAQPSWAADRLASLVRFGPNATPFECEAVAVVVRGCGRVAPVPELAAASRWELGSMFCTQPTVLETYIPAALDGQGFVLHALGHSETADHFYMLCCPVLPAVGEERVAAVREPEKVVLMRATAQGDAFRATAERPFTFSAMGGSMAMDEFRVFGRVRPDGSAKVEFYARVSCLSVRGNGDSYQFSPELVGEMCDARLQMRTVGGAIARLEPRPAPPPRSASPPLLVWVHGSAMMASLGSWTVEPPCGALLFVDCELAGQQSGSGCGLHRGPPFFSSDALMLERALGPVVEAACALGIHPNAVTLSSMATTAAMVFAHIGRSSSGVCGIALAVPALVMYKWLADVLDGAIARSCDRRSRLGGLLDTLADGAFTAAAIVLLASARPGSHRLALDRRLWALALVAAALPWLAIAVAHGPGALVEHSAFKSGDSAVGAAAWVASENTFVICAAISVAYAALSCPSARELFHAATRDPAVVLTLLIFASLAARCLTDAASPLSHRAATAAALAVPAAVVALAVACLSGSAVGQWTSVAIIAAVAVCALPRREQSTSRCHTKIPT